MKYRRLAWVVGPVLLGAAAFAVRSGEARRQWAAWTHSEPVLDCPTSFDLGEREHGETATVRFEVANHGGGELVIDEVSGTCTCVGLEREVGGQFVPVVELRLGPKERAPLALRPTVRGPAGGSMRNLIAFRTNDPTRPHVGIEVVVPRIRGGVVAVPTSVSFGDVVQGSVARQTLEIRDGATIPRSVARLESSDTERVSVRLLPTEDTAGTAEDGQFPLIARAEVEMRTDRLGPGDAEVRIILSGEDRPPDLVPVHGRVAAAVEASPPSLLLPRTSDAGPVYSGSCLCQSLEGKPLTLTLASAPEGLTALIMEGDAGASRRVVQISLDPQRGQSLAGGPPQVIRFRAKAGDREMMLDIPVTCRREG
jgi:hypothetical protein